MKVVGIIQARMSSTRLPGKVLMEAAGKALIILMLERVSRSRFIDSLWVATSDEKSDDRLADSIKKAGYSVYRGSQDNVLSRFWNIGKSEKADAIVRLTGDCPLHDPLVIDSVVEFYTKNRSRYDYVSNVVPPTYPDGLDTEVFSFAALEAAYQGAGSAFDLEHVTPYIRKKAIDSGRESNFYGPADFSHLRWTLDEPEDYAFIKSIYEDLYPKKKIFGWLDVIAWQTKDPKRLLVNAMHKRNTGIIKPDS